MSSRAKLLLPAAVVAAGAALAFLIIKARPEVERTPQRASAPLVRAVEVRLAPVRLDVRSQGVVQPRTEATLVAQVAGRISRVAESFAAGGFFHRGQTLVWIEDADYRLATSQAQAALAQARVRLEREQAEAELAVAEWAELGEGVAPALTRREPQLAEARAAVAAAEAALEQAELHLARTRVTAPYDGRLRRRLAGVGQFVGPAAPLAEIYATDTAEIRAPVPQDELGYLELDLAPDAPGGAGLEAVLTAELGGDRREWQGRVVRVDGELDPRTRMLGVWIEVADPFRRRGAGAAMPMGLFVETRIAGRLAPGVAVLPRSALRADSRVLVIDGDDRLRFRDVELLRAEGDRVLISDGLAEGERVCVSPLDAVVDGMQVRAVLEEFDLRTDRQREAAL